MRRLLPPILMSAGLALCVIGAAAAYVTDERRGPVIDNAWIVMAYGAALMVAGFTFRRR